MIKVFLMVTVKRINDNNGENGIYDENKNYNWL